MQQLVICNTTKKAITNQKLLGHNNLNTKIIDNHIAITSLLKVKVLLILFRSF